MDVQAVVRVVVLALVVAGSLAQFPYGKPGVDAGFMYADQYQQTSAADLEYDPLDPGTGSSRPAEHTFAYGVNPKGVGAAAIPQGGAQSHSEERHGDKVRGSYSVLENDGSVRTVSYTVDPKNGFQANVHRVPDATKAHQFAQQQAPGRARPGSSAIRPVPRPIKVNQAVSEIDIPGFPGTSTDDAVDADDHADFTDTTDFER